MQSGRPSPRSTQWAESGCRRQAKPAQRPNRSFLNRALAFEIRSGHLTAEELSSPGPPGLFGLSVGYSLLAEGPVDGRLNVCLASEGIPSCSAPEQFESSEAHGRSSRLLLNGFRDLLPSPLERGSLLESSSSGGGGGALLG